MSALHDFLSTHNDVEGLSELLRAGEDPNFIDLKFRTPLHIAVMKCELNPEETDQVLPVFQELINYGANIDAEDRTGCTPLHLAVICRNCRLIEKLLDLGAEVNASSDEKYNALHYASGISYFPRDTMEYKSYESELGVVKMLLKKEPNVDFQNVTGVTPLMLAVRYDNYHIVRELLKKKASVNLQDESGSSAMHLALDRGEVNVRIVYELARHGGVFDVIDKKGKTPAFCYLERLEVNYQDTANNALLLFKLFTLQGYDFRRDEEISLLIRIHETNRHLNLLDSLRSYEIEIEKMAKLELSRDFSVGKAVQILAFTSNYENKNHIPFEVLDKLLKKLITNEFPRYSGIIVSSISRPYLMKKFSEMYCTRELAVSFFEVEELILISKYLTNLEMLRIMIACFREISSSGFFSRFRRLLRCSIS